MIEPSERALLESTVRDAIAAAHETGTVDAALHELGWLELLVSEPTDAIDVVFGALGRTNAAATALDDVLAWALGAEPRADLAVLLPPFGSWEPPGRIEGGRVDALGLTTARARTARELLVACATGSETCAVVVPISSARRRAVHGIDPDAGFQIAQVEHLAPAGRTFPVAAWESAVATGRRAVSHQVAGAGRTMLALARAHATERVQFDRPIASFQAVRHRLADALVAVEALEATVHAADDEQSPLTAALAKATAGRTARTVAAHCQQVLAGIGFTTDHPFHRYLKRTMLLGGLFGSADDLALDVGRRLLADRRVPTLIEL